MSPGNQISFLSRRLSPPRLPAEIVCLILFYFIIFSNYYYCCPPPVNKPSPTTGGEAFLSHSFVASICELVITGVLAAKNIHFISPPLPYVHAGTSGMSVGCLCHGGLEERWGVDSLTEAAMRATSLSKHIPAERDGNSHGWGHCCSRPSKCIEN